MALSDCGCCARLLPLSTGARCSAPLEPAHKLPAGAAAAEGHFSLMMRKGPHMVAMVGFAGLAGKCIQVGDGVDLYMFELPVFLGLGWDVRGQVVLPSCGCSDPSFTMLIK